MQVRKQVQRRRVRSNTGVRSRVSFGFLSTEVDTRGERLGSLIGLSYDLTDMRWEAGRTWRFDTTTNNPIFGK